jgi:hypothetical protein
VADRVPGEVRVGEGCLRAGRGRRSSCVYVSPSEDPLRPSASSRKTPRKRYSLSSLQPSGVCSKTSAEFSPSCGPFFAPPLGGGKRHFVEARPQKRRKLLRLERPAHRRSPENLAKPAQLRSRPYRYCREWLAAKVFKYLIWQMINNLSTLSKQMVSSPGARTRVSVCGGGEAPLLPPPRWLASMRA